jgi:hypothetical protein
LCAAALFDQSSKVAEAGVESAEEALDGEPLHAASSSLDTGDVSRIHLETGGKLLLRDPGPITQHAKRAAEDDQIGVSGVFIHDGQ